MTKTLYIVRGCPGDGKTTLALDLSKGRHSPKEIAADNMPGLYVDGIYQNHLQKQSHVWCQETVEAWMKRGESVIVHNTFTRHIYIKPYLQLAKQYDYAVHIIHSEAVILPDGSRTQTTHGVPQEILDGMRSGFEAFNPVPKQGITPADIAKQMDGLLLPHVIIFDMDGTVKRSKFGGFSKTPDDFQFTDEFGEWARSDRNPGLKLYIASNQRGVSTGQKTEAFFEEEIKLLDKALKNIFLDVEFERMYFALEKPDYNAIIYEKGEWLESSSFKLIFDKPNTGIFEDIYINNPTARYWIVGDAHTDNTATDWQFAQNCQRQFPNVNIRYVPIEMLNVFWSLLK